MKNKTRKNNIFILTFLLMQTTSVFGMDPDDKLDISPSSTQTQRALTKSDTMSECTFMDPRGFDETLEIQKHTVDLTLGTTGSPFDPRRSNLPCLEVEIEFSDKKRIFSDEVDEKILVHLENFHLSLEERSALWKELNDIMTIKGIYPFCIGVEDPHFIACGLWRAHHEIMLARYQMEEDSLPFRSLLSCLLTDRLALINKKLQLNKMLLLKNLIQTNPYFTTLELFKAGITDTHLLTLDIIPHLRELSLEENHITDKGIEIVVKYPKLQKLNLAKNNVTSKGVGIIAKSQKLKHLNLYKNPVGDDGAVHLSHNTSINYLDLRETGIADEGAEALANNKVLTDLRLRYNKITDRGAGAFLKSDHLTHLELARNQISEDRVFFLEHLMPSNAYLRKIHDPKILPPDYLPSQKERVRILCIDGGGIRGLLPGCILKYVEDGLTEKLGNQFYFSNHLDLVAGTSTGGIITLGMVMPGERGRPKYVMQTLIDLYTKNGQEILALLYF